MVAVGLNDLEGLLQPVQCYDSLMFRILKAETALVIVSTPLLPEESRLYHYSVSSAATSKKWKTGNYGLEIAVFPVLYIISFYY